MSTGTITKIGRRRYRWKFERVIENKRVRKTKLVPAGISAAEADKLGREYGAEVYAVETGVRKQTDTIGECVRLHIEDEGCNWKDFETRCRLMDKSAPEYENQGVLQLYEWSVNFTGCMRAYSRSRWAPRG